MPFKINLRLLNMFLVAGAIIAFIIELSIDFPTYANTSPHETPFLLFYWSWFSTAKIVSIILDGAAGATFFIFAWHYNTIRKSKENQYLASLIMLTMIYQGLARVIEVYFMLFGSDLYGLVNVVGRYYFPLEITSAVIFIIVAFDVFLFPALEEATRDRQSKFLFIMNIITTVISVTMVFFIYITNVDTKVVIGITGFCIFVIIVVVVIITCTRIFRLSSTMPISGNKRAVQGMGIQLLVLMATIILFMISELGDFINIDTNTVYILRAIKDGLYLILAILYLYSFIKPARSKKIDISSGSEN
jgi:hypothetical protein